jgi:hypothetical protein
MIVLGGWATGTGQYALRISISIRSVKLQDHYTTPYQIPSSFGISASRNDRDASALGRPTRDVGGGGGRSGDQFRSEVGGEACGGTRAENSFTALT